MKRYLIWILCLGMPALLTAQATFDEFQIYHHLEEGLAKVRVRRYGEAINDFSEVIRKNPNIPEAYMYRGDAFFVQKRYQPALEDYNRAIELFNVELLTKGQATANPYLKGNDGISIVDSDMANMLQYRIAILYTNRGAAKHHLSRFREALEDYDKALALNPNLNTALENKQNTARVMNSQQGRDNSYSPSYNNSRSPGYNQYDNRGAVEDAEPQRSGLNKIFAPNRSNSRSGSQSSYSTTSSGTSQGSAAYTSSAYGERSPSTSSTGKKRTTLFNSSKDGMLKKPSVQSKTYPWINIEEVELADRFTRVTFSVNNNTNQAIGLTLRRPGSEGAHYITDQAATRIYRLIAIKGLDDIYRTTWVRVGEKLTFDMEFEAIPQDLRYIHIMEDNDIPGMDNINFYDIRLN